METQNNKNVISVALPDSGVLAKSRHQRPDFSQIPHAHSHFSLMYIVSGAGQCTIEGIEHKLHPDSVIVLHKDVEHQLQDQTRNNMTVFSIYFDPCTAGLDENICNSLFRESQPSSVPVYYARQMRQMIRQILHEQKTKPPSYQLAIRQHLAQMILQLHRLRLTTRSGASAKKHNSETRAKETLDHISKNYFEPFSLPEAAKMSKLSQRQFSSMCKKITGTSFVRFVNTLRTEKAAELLANTEAPVAAIAFEVGYEELSTFYRAFKKIHKTAPLKYRNNATDIF